MYSLPGGLVSMLPGVKVTVLGTDDNDKPVIVKVEHQKSGGVAVLLQVHLNFNTKYNNLTFLTFK